jgi:signal transduction histidine kinase
MARRSQSAGARRWLHLPGRTIRVRLTLAYWMLFIISGAAVLALTAAIWQGTSKTVRAPTPARQAAGTPGGIPGGTHPGGVMLAGSQHSTDLHKLLIASGLSLAIVAIPAITLGWLVAGRYLRPLRTITATARDISATNLHERLELAGPQDELKQLGDTFDDLLARLERSFQSERRFIANASHELRTPLTTMRASLDVAMAKPGPLPAPTVTLAERLRPELDHIDRLLENFLTLAHTQQGPGIDQCNVSLSALASAAIERCSAATSVAGLKVSQEHNGPTAWVQGSPTLLSRMVDNLIDNAVKHNQPGGWIGVKTTVDGVAARLVVENGGAVLAQHDVRDLTSPFLRLGTERTGSERGSGLGLSIVEAIAEAHSGTVGLRARQDGGLQVTVTLPLAPTSVEGHPI